MADNRNICEEIEIAIYSGTELTDEQKNHIENCEECRALLTQMTQLGNDLNALAVPGIREGEIADRVMLLPQGSKIIIEAPVVRGKKGAFEKELKSYKKSGYGRVKIDGIIYDLQEDIHSEYIVPY